MSKKRTGVLVALSATALLVVGGLAWEQVFPNRQATPPKMHLSSHKLPPGRAQPRTIRASKRSRTPRFQQFPPTMIPPRDILNTLRVTTPVRANLSIPMTPTMHRTSNATRSRRAMKRLFLLAHPTRHAFRPLFPWTKACFSTTRLKKSVPRILMGPNATTQHLIGMSTCWCGFPMQHTIKTCLRRPRHSGQDGRKAWNGRYERS